MPWPTPQDYQEAIQAPRVSFSDPELQAGTVLVTALGLPRPITGNFASVYRMHCAGRDWAVRCFWREFSDQQSRYAAISDHLRAARLPYTVGFEYLPRGIRVRGQWYPILKMEWVEGELLGEYVGRHLHDPAALQALAERWKAMIASLEAAGVAHGDLQHGNVLVRGGELRLVDYDGMYVPALAGRGSHEVGHQHYQHPRRDGADFGPTMDRFSAWSVYLSLLALAGQPSLWTGQSGEECLLLRREDYESTPSGTMQVLETHQTTEVPRLARQFRSFVGLNPLDVPPLIDVIPQAVAAPLHVNAAPPPPTADSVPPWNPLSSAWSLLFPSVPGQAVVLRAPRGAPAWLADYLEPEPPKEFVRSTVPLRCAVGALVAGVGAVVAMGVMGVVPGTALIAATLASLVVVVAVVAFLYRLEPAVQELAQRRAYFSTTERELRSVERRIRRLQRRLAALEERERRASERARAERSTVRGDEQSELGAVEAQSAAVLAALDQSLQKVNRVEQTELAGALQAQQADYIGAVLRGRTTWSAVIPGVGWTAKARVLALGIFSAADLTPDRLDALKPLGGTTVQSLLRWRAEGEAEARRSAPQQIAPRLRDPVVTRANRERERLQSARATAEADATRQRSQIVSSYARRYDVQDADGERRTREYADAAVLLREQLTVLEGEARATRDRLDRYLAELQPFAAISLSAYLARVADPSAS